MVDDADDGVDLFLSVFDREKFSTHFGTDGKQTSNSIGGVRMDFPITLQKNWMKSFNKLFLGAVRNMGFTVEESQKPLGK